MPNRFASTIPGAIPWRKRAPTDPAIAALVHGDATDEEAADILAFQCAEYRRMLDRYLEGDSRFMNLVEQLVAVKT